MTILIFGGTKGIGLSLADQCAASFNVVIAGRNKPRNSSHDYVKCDVANHEEVKAAFDYTFETYGPIHVVVNSAGYGHCKSLDELTIEEWDAMSRVTVDGNFYIAKCAYEMFTAQTFGHFIIIGSMASGGAWGKEIGYGTLKGAQAKFGMHLLNQFETDNQQGNNRFYCHVICPGSVYTDFWKRIPEREIEPDDSLEPADVARILQTVIDSPGIGYQELMDANHIDYLDIGPLPPFEAVPQIIKVAHQAHP